MPARTRVLIVTAVALALIALQSLLMKHAALVGPGAITTGFILTLWAPAVLALVLSNWWSIGR